MNHKIKMIKGWFYRNELWFSEPFKKLPRSAIDLLQCFATEIRKKQSKKKNVKCDTIQNILDNSKFNNKKIDFLNIDIEGAEEKVLKSLNFNIYDPTIICVEILGYRSMEKEEQEINIKNDNIYNDVEPWDVKTTPFTLLLSLGM